MDSRRLQVLLDFIVFEGGLHLMVMDKRGEAGRPDATAVGASTGRRAAAGTVVERLGFAVPFSL